MNNPDAKTYFEISLGEPAAAATPAKKLTVGVEVPTLANPFWVGYTNFMKQVAEALNIELKIVDVQNREDKQIADLESLIAGGVDGLV
ncbi:MAG: sugar ABC transporter substrate-binding protein, partial [Deltaproteobacteria bacterium]|nr:sugar ABC transporter substrate-binding protein [Deltaproteobacteria bacterium]